MDGSPCLEQRWLSMVFWRTSQKRSKFLKKKVYPPPHSDSRSDIAEKHPLASPPKSTVQLECCLELDVKIQLVGKLLAPTAKLPEWKKCLRFLAKYIG